MPDHPNVAVVKRFFEAFGSKDMPAVRTLLAEDAVFHTPGNSLVSGDHTGHDEIIGFFRKTGELSGGTFKTEVRNIVGNQDKVLVFQHVTGSRNGKTLDMDGAFVVHIEDGRWKEVWAFHFDGEHADAFWS